MGDVDVVVSTRTGPFKVEADFDGVEVKSTSTYVLQLCNDSADEQRVTVKNHSGALAVLDSNELPFSECTIAKSGKVSLAIAWTPRRVHFLEERLEIVLHGKRSIQVQCNGTSMPNFGSSSPGENSQPNLFSNSTGLCVDTISMRSGSESSGTACTSPSARMQRVQSRMRRSLSHIHEAFDDTQRSCSRTRSISREPSVERFNRRASIGGASECSARSRRSLSNTLSSSMQGRLRTPQIQPPDISRRNSICSRRNSLSSQSTHSVGLSSDQRTARNRPQSARSVSSAARTRGSSASGRAPSTSGRAPSTSGRAPFTSGRVASVRGTDSRGLPTRGPPSCNVSSSVERKAPQSRHPPLRKPEKSCSHLSADSLKRLSASLSPSKSMPQVGGHAARPRALRQPTGVRTPSTGAPSMPVRHSHASSLRSTLHQAPSATPRHMEQTESFAIYHTESWQRKQDHAFTQWLNMVLGEAYKDSNGAQEAAVNRQVLLRCRQQLGQLRENDDSIVHALNQVEQQIKANRLCFKENSFLDDAALRKKAVRAIMSYHPLWLRLGIDTVLNRRTFQEGDQDHLGVVSSSDLEAVVREELLSDTTLLGGASLLRRGDRRELLSQLVIYRVLTLVIILDRIPSKMQLPQQAPFLFRLGSECKSSESVLMEVLHSSLSGVGKLSKHLAKMHYEVHFTQRDVDEWPMSISSLGTDLSNGIIVCKLVTLLLGQDVMAEVRRPTAAQRVIKVRNLRIALAAVTDAGINLAELSANRGEANEKVAVKVDNVLSGHCREVLALLWAVASKSFERTVPVDHLQTELRLLERKIKNKGLWSDSCQFSLQPGNDTPVARQLFGWVRAVCGLYGVTVRNCGSSFTDGSVLCLLIHHYVPLLVPWTSIQIPPPVPLDVAQHVLGSEHLGGLTSLSWADYVGMQNSVIQEEIEEHRSGIIHNFELIHKASRCLGDVPDMLSASDITTRFCDERAVLLFLSSLCPRLLAFASEGKAAHTIAKWWRWARVRLITLNRGELVYRVRAHLHKESVVARWHHLCDQVHHIPFLARLERARAERDRARAAISSLRVAVRCAILAVRLRHRVTRVREQLEQARLRKEAQLVRMHSAAGLILAHYRGHRVRQQVAQQHTAAKKIAVAWRTHKLHVASRAAIVIQSHVRGWRARQQLAYARRAAVIIQSHVRGIQVRNLQRDRSHAAVQLQAAWRMYVCRHQYVYLRKQVVIIQTATRGMLCRSECMKRSLAASKLQGAVRLLHTRRRLAMRRNAATLIQARVRGAVARNGFLSMRAAAITIQAAVRMRYAKMLHVANRHAAVVIQSAWRRRCACLAYARSVASIQRIQAYARSFLVRLHLERQRRAAIIVQAAVRGRIGRQQYIQTKQSITIVQASVRGLIARRQYARDVQSVVLLQAASRQWKARRVFMRQRSAALKLQAATRGMRARVVLRQQHAAAQRLQAAWHAHRCRQEFQAHVCQVVRCQALVRGFLVRRQIAQQAISAVSLQRHWRGFHGRQQCAGMKASVVFLQAQARRVIARRRFLRLRYAAIVIQAYARMWLTRQEMEGANLAALNIQTCWRMWACRQQFKRVKAAAGAIQLAWRAYAVRRRQRAAAVCIQSWWRMYHALSEFQAQRTAVVCIQRNCRGFSCRQQIAKWNASAVIIQKNMARFHVLRCIARQRVAVWRIESAYAALQSERLRMHREQVAAARYLQQAWRVHVVRKEVKRHCAALAVITRMLPQIRAGCQKCREDRHLRALARAAVPIQAVVRGWIQRSKLERQKRAAVTIQAHFRGRLARTASTPEVKHMARRLKRLEPMPDNHSHCLGPRVMAALSQLLCSNSIEQARSACEAAAWGTTYSRNACAWLLRDGALSALAHFMKSCSTNKSHSSMLTAILTILVNILNHPEHVLHVEPRVLAGLVPIVTDLLQLYRDTGGVFRLAVSVLRKACARSGVLGHIAVERTLVKWKGVYRVLYTRLQKEGQYLSKLEHKKGSDASACNATRSLIQTSEQLKILKQLIKPLHKRVVKQLHEHSSSRPAAVQHADAIAELPQPGPGDWIHEITKGGSMWVPKNTKVRATFREVLHNVHGFELPEASEDEEGGETCGDVLTDTANSRRIHSSGLTAPPTFSKRTAPFQELKCNENVDPEHSTA